MSKKSQAKALRKKIKKKKKKLNALERKYKRILALGGHFNGNEVLTDIIDFPFKQESCWMVQLKQNAKITTVEDLVFSSPKEILDCRYWGEKTLARLCDWMDKNKIHFIETDN